MSDLDTVLLEEMIDDVRSFNPQTWSIHYTQWLTSEITRLIDRLINHDEQTIKGRGHILRECFTDEGLSDRFISEFEFHIRAIVNKLQWRRKMGISYDEKNNRVCVRLRGDMGVMPFRAQENTAIPWVMIQKQEKTTTPGTTLEENPPAIDPEEETDYVGLWFSDPRSASVIISALSDAAQSIEGLSKEIVDYFEIMKCVADKINKTPTEDIKDTNQ